MPHPLDTTTNHTSRLRCLVADDEPDIRRLVSVLLQRLNIETMTAENGEEALRLQTQRPFDLMVLDITMPVMDGLQLLEQLRAQGDMTPAIMLTAHQEMTYIRAAMAKYAVVDYIIKPFTMDNLFKAVSSAIETMERVHRQEKERTENRLASFREIRDSLNAVLNIAKRIDNRAGDVIVDAAKEIESEIEKLEGDEQR